MPSSDSRPLPPAPGGPIDREWALERFASLCRTALEKGDIRTARACLADLRRLHASGLRIEVALRLIPAQPAPATSEALDDPLS